MSLVEQHDHFMLLAHHIFIYRLKKKGANLENLQPYTIGNLHQNSWEKFAVTVHCN
jgi:hypothetical protein